MKKIFCVLLAMIISASLVSVVYAANEGIVNSEEQRVLDVLNTEIKVTDGTVKLEDVNIKKAENYFKTIDMTKEQADEIIGYLQKGIALIKENDVSNVWDLSHAKKLELLGYGNQATNVCGMTLTYNRTRSIFEIRDNETSALVYEQEAVLKITGEPIPAYVYVVVAFGIFAIGILVYKKRKAAIQK